MIKPVTVTATYATVWRLELDVDEVETVLMRHFKFWPGSVEWDINTEGYLRGVTLVQEVSEIIKTEEKS